jgi:hypothetical protein
MFCFLPFIFPYQIDNFIWEIEKTMFDFPNFSKKQPKEKEGLDRALALGLITEKEFLELKIERAKAELENLTKKKKK